MQSRSALHIGFNFENLMWLFTRISGLAMFLFALVGILSAFMMSAREYLDIDQLVRWTFFPNSYHVVNSDIPDVTVGWANAYWQVMQMLIVCFGITHGVNGLRSVIEDYLQGSWLRVFLRGFLFLFWLFMLIVAVYVILTV
ncbi:MAG: hypothetical protein JXB15_00025 [Anaerolineales bacterium]|nr:hypothetical protein [Anaerolineales bacterium]